MTQSTQNKIEQLKSLEDLRQSGAISQEEFDTLKAEMLGQLPQPSKDVTPEASPTLDVPSEVKPESPNESTTPPEVEQHADEDEVAPQPDPPQTTESEASTLDETDSPWASRVPVYLLISGIALLVAMLLPRFQMTDGPFWTLIKSLTGYHNFKVTHFFFALLLLTLQGLFVVGCGVGFVSQTYRKHIVRGLLILIGFQTFSMWLSQGIHYTGLIRILWILPGVLLPLLVGLRFSGRYAKTTIGLGTLLLLMQLSNALYYAIRDPDISWLILELIRLGLHAAIVTVMLIPARRIGLITVFAWIGTTLLDNVLSTCLRLYNRISGSLGYYSFEDVFFVLKIQWYDFFLRRELLPSMSLIALGIAVGWTLYHTPKRVV